MHAEQRRVADDGLHYLAIFPDDYDADADYPLVVMLHGFGANMQDLAGLAPSINRKGYVYVCPNAPIEFELSPGMIGYGWHPPRGQATEEHFAQAEALLDAFFTEALTEFRANDGRAVLLGFSQGGGMTYRMGLGRPDRFAALVALSASLPDPEVLRPPPAGPPQSAGVRGPRLARPDGVHGQRAADAGVPGRRKLQPVLPRVQHGP